MIYTVYVLDTIESHDGSEVTNILLMSDGSVKEEKYQLPEPPQEIVLSPEVMRHFFEDSHADIPF